MDRFFSSTYRGDPGVPHSGPARFENILIGSVFTTAVIWFYPHMYQLSGQYNWHDKAMLYEQYHWKKAIEKKKRYKFLWNEAMDEKTRTSYYYNWPTYFR